MSKYILNHTKKYGYDRDLIFIKDNVISEVKSIIDSLNFMHGIDSSIKLKKDVIETGKNGYCIYKDNFILYEVNNNLQKARERIFEVLCHVRNYLQNNGLILNEYLSYDEKTFFLILFSKQPIIVFQGNINNNLITIKISNLLEIFTLQTILKPIAKYDFSLFTLNQNRGEVLNVVRKLNNKYSVLNYDSSIKDFKEYSKDECIGIYVILTPSLIKKNMMKVVLLDENVEYNIDVNKFDSMYQLFIKKINSYKQKKYLSNIEKNMEKYTKEFACIKCIKKKYSDMYPLKLFQQRKQGLCPYCNKSIGYEFLLTHRKHC